MANRTRAITVVGRVAISVSGIREAVTRHTEVSGIAVALLNSIGAVNSWAAWDALTIRLKTRFVVVSARRTGTRGA